MKYIAVIGKTPEISIAELECIFGNQNILPITRNVVAFNSNDPLASAKRLGGTVKIAKILSHLPSNNWEYIRSYLEKNASLFVGFLPDTKFNVGISAYDINVSPQKINATALGFKKLAKNYGKNIRIIPNKESTLNSAQIIHNNLISDKGTELVFVGLRDGKALIAQTIYEQPIEEYALRDQSRPFRDAKVGMLPPKLAQSIINLASPKEGDFILDPFCGTGVILQEAGLMGFEVYGTDIDERMVSYSDKNLSWLIVEKNNPPFGRVLEVADATSYEWRKRFDLVACETYLGRALSSLPDNQTLSKIIQDCNQIHKKFLQNLSRQTKPGFRMCIAVPAWKKNNDFLHLPLLDHLENMGYNRLSFVHVDTKRLIYHRKDQYVARELVVLERI